MENKDFLSSILEMMYPHTILLCLINFIIASLWMGTNIFSLQVLFLSIAIILLTGGLNSFNNCFDIAEDKLSKPTRPLPSKRIGYRMAVISTSSLIILSIVIGFAVHAISGVVVLLGAILAVLYSVPPIRLKRLFLVSTAIIAANYTLLPWLLAGTLNNFSNFPWAFMLLLFILAFVSVSVKDLRDEKADSLTENGTLPVLIGSDKTKHLILSSSLAIIIASPFILYLDTGSFIFALLLAFAFPYYSVGTSLGKTEDYLDIDRHLLFYMLLAALLQSSSLSLKIFFT
jgi:4-hydroxybenzoate polyprenyltransferase